MRVRFLSVLSLLFFSQISFANPTYLVTKIGNPDWEIVDVNRFTGGVTSFQEWESLMAEVLPNFFPIRTVFAPPYNTEITDALTAVGKSDRLLFSESEFAAGNVIGVAFLSVPTGDAVTGSSKDFTSGLIIPKSSFPLTSQWTLYRNNQIFDSGSATVDFTDIGLDGWSRSYHAYGSSMDFAPAGVTDPKGFYSYRIVEIDANGDGYEIIVPFVVY